MEIIYSKNETQFHTRELTPAHVYVSTSDFAAILSDMERGLLPVGTGKPFPVEFDNEGRPSRMEGNMSPWAMQNTNLMHEPDHPIGPNELFGSKLI